MAGEVNLLEQFKVCSRCSQSKSLDHFAAHKRQPDGLQYWCKECASIYALSNRAAIYDSRRQFETLNPEKKKERHRRNIIARHGISLEDYTYRLINQSYRCAICKTHADDLPRALAVDHDHNCCPGKNSCGLCIRGLLCDACNRGIAAFRDDQESLRSALRYLGEVV